MEKSATGSIMFSTQRTAEIERKQVCLLNSVQCVAGAGDIAEAV